MFLVQTGGKTENEGRGETRKQEVLAALDSVHSRRNQVVSSV